MKGIVLAGGLGSRLLPLTLATNKHLLPVFNKPMIYYPLETLAKAGVDEVMVVVSGPHAGSFISILKNGEQFGFKKLVYGYQEKPDGGIADALEIAASFAEGEPIAVILGDNTTDSDLKLEVDLYLAEQKISELPTAKIFLKEVSDPTSFGVARFDQHNLVEIIEKPKSPPSNLAVSGIYLYDKHVFDFIRKCSPSERGELEITDVNNMYLKDGNLLWAKLTGFWQDAGTFETLHKANVFWAGQT